MEVPILKQGSYLVVSVPAGLTDTDLLRLQEDLAEQVRRFQSRGIIVDVGLLDVMDSFAARSLRAVAGVAKLRGARTVIVGIQPEVAFSMVQLGLYLEGVPTALDLEEGLVLLGQQVKGGTSGHR